MEQENKEQIRLDWALSGLSIRSLAVKYGLSTSRVQRIMSEKKETKKPKISQAPADLQREVAQLKELLRKERLRTELLNNIIDIADKELGTNIRKKSGTRQSE